MDRISIHPDVAQALKSGRPIVALETAVITSGLPRTPLASIDGLDLPGWRLDQPVNLELGRALHRIVRDAGAAPAMIAVLHGVLCIGLDEDQFTRLAADARAGKASVNDLAAAMSSGASAGTTVSATLAASTLATSPANRVRVFATGGIGGVHRGWQSTPDISADLRTLAETPICVVCSGAKSILDVPATLEALETLGVPVVGFRTESFPRFQSPGSDELKLRHCVESVAGAAQICDLHWKTLGRSTGIILANPVPQEHAMDAAELDAAINRAENLASKRGITGPARTPFLLDQLAQLTHGRSLRANLALLINNARLAGELAVQLTL